MSGIEAPPGNGVAVVGFAFALCKRPKPSATKNPVAAALYAKRMEADPTYAYDEPNACNARLGAEVLRLALEHNAVLISVQWEIERFFQELFPGEDRGADVVVNLHDDGSYLTSKDVWNATKVECQARGISRVILVAQPGLHRRSVTNLAKRDGFTVIEAKVNPIGFEKSKSNSQWWTKSAPALFVYAVLKTLHLIKDERPQ